MFLILGDLTDGAFADPAEESFARWMTGFDLAGSGTIVATERVSIEAPRHCRFRFGDTMDGVVVRIRLSELYLGAASDSTVPVLLQAPHGELLERDWYWNGQPGGKVFFWANRVCDFLWHPVGHVFLVSPGDTLMSGERPFVPVSTILGVSVADAKSLVASGVAYHGTGAFDGAADVVLVRLNEYRKEDDPSPHIRRFRYTCTGLESLFGTGARYPDSLRFSLQDGCYPFAGPGDTLVVPLPHGFAGGELFVESCTRQWKIQDAFVVGLGVFLADLREKLYFSGSEVRLQRIGKKDS